MIDLAGMLPTVAYYWPVESQDATGGFTFAWYQQIACRWQDDAVLFRDRFGRESISDAVVYSQTLLAIGGFLSLAIPSVSDAVASTTDHTDGLSMVFTDDHFEDATGKYGSAVIFTGKPAGMAAHDDPLSHGAKEIRRVGASPSLSGDQTLYKVLL